MSPQPGEVYLLDLGMKGKTRPVVIVSRLDSDAPRALAVYVPLTTQSQSSNDRSSNYEVPIPSVWFLDSKSFANTLGIASTPYALLGRRLGRLPQPVLAAIRDSLRFTLDL